MFRILVAMMLVAATLASAQYDTLYRKNKTYHLQRALHGAYRTTTADVVMFGNSITFGANWSELLGRPGIVNRGIGGDNTYGFLNRIDDVVRLHPKFCFVMGGINDIFADIPVDTVFSNYRRILEILAANKIIPVIQSTLYVSPLWKRADVKNPEVTGLNRKLLSYAQEQQIAFIDLNKLFSENGTLKDEFTFDGVHLTAPAYLLWAKEIDRLLIRSGY